MSLLSHCGLRSLSGSFFQQRLKHSVLQLSRGLRDVVGLSLRMAFIDVMFPQEKPVLILDDPFVNLDDAKLKGASEFIKTLSNEYQVVYFTCQQARKF